MRYIGAPKFPLRLRTVRTVCDSVWVAETQLHQGPDAQALLGDLQGRPTPKPGEVDTFTPPTAMKEACARMTGAAEQVFEALCGVKGEQEPMSVGTVQLVCRGARPHYDVGSPAWERTLFWVLALQDSDTDLLFGHLGLRFPVRAGMLFVFDPGQPHAVVSRGSQSFRASDFKKVSNRQHFLTCERKLSPDEWRALGVVIDAPDNLDLQMPDVRTYLVGKACTLRRP